MQIFHFVKNGGIASVCSIQKAIITDIQTFNIRVPFYFNEGYL